MAARPSCLLGNRILLPEPQEPAESPEALEEGSLLRASQTLSEDEQNASHKDKELLSKHLQQDKERNVLFSYNK